MTQPRPVIKPATSDRTPVDDYRDRLRTDLDIAARVHRSMIPAKERRGNLEIVCDFQPMALLAGRVNSFVLNQAPRVCHPCELVDALNEFVFRTFREAELYLTLGEG